MDKWSSLPIAGKYFQALSSMVKTQKKLIGKIECSLIPKLGQHHASPTNLDVAWICILATSILR